MSLIQGAAGRAELWRVVTSGRRGSTSPWRALAYLVRQQNLEVQYVPKDRNHKWRRNDYHRHGGAVGVLLSRGN